MNNKPYKTSLSILFTLLASGCATTHYVTQEEPTLHRDDCSITQKKTLTEEYGTQKTVIAVKNEFIGFDSNCAKHEKSAIERKTAHEIKMAQLNTASELLVISFKSNPDTRKQSEYLKRILSNLESKDRDWKASQEKALAKQGLTQNDIIRAEVIDLIYKTKSDEKLIKNAASSEILRIHRREKYPNRYNVPRQIVEKELAEQKLTINDIEQIFSQANTKKLSTCKAIENKKKGLMVFVCK